MFSGKGSRYESFGKELDNSGRGRDNEGRGWVIGQGISGFLEGCSVVEVEVLDVSGRSTGDCRVDLVFRGRVRGGKASTAVCNVVPEYGGKVSFVARVAFGKGRVMA